MKTLNLFFDMEFTSLSPDAQPISLGIVSDNDKSFYAEFTDFDINRCDDWVKENVVKSLKMYGKEEPVENYDPYADNVSIFTPHVGQALAHWLYQFDDYHIQFICDCGTWDWWFLIQLLAEWDEIKGTLVIPMDAIPPNMTIEEFAEEWRKADGALMTMKMPERVSFNNIRTGLPKLPENISPVPFDLNDLIAIKKGITSKEAFDLNREELIANRDEADKHHALWDAKVIKEVYNKLINPHNETNP